MTLEFGTNESGNGESIIKQFIKGVITSLAVTGVTEGFKMYRSLYQSTIDVSEWDSSYNKINRMVYCLNKEKYTKHRIPTTRKDDYELTPGTSYIIPLKNKGTFIRVEAYKSEERALFKLKHIRVSFHGKNKYENRRVFMRQVIRLTDKRHIHVKQLGNEYNVGCDIIPHTFDNIIVENKVKNDIINGLNNWKKSKEWYTNHQLVHKIGIFLYGQPGTGKSTIARAVSAMFDNAPIMTLDNQNIMGSINSIIQLRKQQEGIIIILIEDFDMIFENRDMNNGEPEPTIENSSTKQNSADQSVSNTMRKKENLIDQNIVFQLLDGIYSTEETIYIATTNYKERLDDAMIRYGRFDIQEELKYFDAEQALSFVQMLDYNKDVLDSLNVTYPVQPSLLQSKVMEYRAEKMVKGEL